LRRKPARPAVVPVFLPCPTCGLPVQPGKNPNGLAWHDCQFVVNGAGKVAPTVEGIREGILLRLRDQAATATPKECIAILAALDKMSPREEAEEKPTSELDDADLVVWMAASTARPGQRG